MSLTRIECCAFLKSLIEAKVPSTHWDDAVAKCSEIMDARATAAPSPAAPSPAALSPAAGGVSAELECVSIEDHGNRVRVEATGYANGKYFTAWDKNAAAARQLDAGMKFTAEIVEKPNPKGKYPHLNLQEIKIQLDNLADIGDQPTGGKIASVDLPF
jgi:hypothetical protein